MPDKITTANKFFNQWMKNNSIDNIEGCLIEFAKLHVQKALEQASEDVDFSERSYMSHQEGTWLEVDKDSILNSYPLENIK